MDSKSQLQHLANFSPFRQAISPYQPDFSANKLEIFQVNLGKWCNQTCRHCHVDAGPQRKESMSLETANLCLKVIAESPSIHTVDLTGGAPEGHQAFKTLVEGARIAGKKVIDRCNLTILTEPGFEWLPEFLAQNQVEVVSSLPSFSPSRTNKQRGNLVFERSIEGLKLLNALGYGSQLPLHLVYNPSGIFLSAPQQELEREFKEKLHAAYGIIFNQLYCINNMPIARFLESLLRANKLDEYMETLIQAFNPGTLDGLMCRSQISVGYDGTLYDCDFNQMLEIPSQTQQTLSTFNSEIAHRKIALANHCYGCTAGAGSSCGGEIA